LYFIHTMNDIYSQNELIYHRRMLAAEIRNAIKHFSVVVLSGARQVGKSTLLQNEKPLKDWLYLTLDNFDILDQAARNPEALWTQSNNIIIDEVQKSPRLLDAVKQAVDAHPQKYRFILSGSSNLMLMKKVSESLAGRAVYFNLLPMTISELADKPASDILNKLITGDFPKEDSVSPFDPLPYMWRGLMPALMKFEHSPMIVRWWESYIITYLERDLRQLTQIDSLADYRRLMTSLALRCAQLLNQSEVSRDINISQPTIHRYINLLETTHIIHRLPAFAVNRTKRLMKTPKLMWLDPGLVSYLSGLYSLSELQTSNMRGKIFESMIFLHLYAFSQLQTPKPLLYYWRTSTGNEVDFVLEWGRKILAIEVRMTHTARYNDIQNLQLFIQEYPETHAGVLIYTGTQIKRMDDKIIALPWRLLA